MLTVEKEKKKKGAGEHGMEQERGRLCVCGKNEKIETESETDEKELTKGRRVIEWAASFVLIRSRCVRVEKDTSPFVYLYSCK